MGVRAGQAGNGEGDCPSFASLQTLRPALSSRVRPRMRTSRERSRGETVTPILMTFVVVALILVLSLVSLSRVRWPRKPHLGHW